jgi:fluoroacetyl-CoA thioesterase
MRPIEVGTTSTVRCAVEAEHLAARLANEPEESYPAVFSTPWLLAQFERAAAKVLRPILESGQVSVGARATMEHLAPTPLGGEVTAYARYVGMDGALYLFEVWATDEAGLIGKGTHARAIVPGAAVEKRAEKRSAQLSNRVDGFS